MPNLAASILHGLGFTIGALLALALGWSLATLWLDRVVWLPPPCVFGVIGPCIEPNVDA